MSGHNEMNGAAAQPQPGQGRMGYGQGGPEQGEQQGQGSCQGQGAQHGQGGCKGNCSGGGHGQGQGYGTYGPSVAGSDQGPGYGTSAPQQHGQGPCHAAGYGYGYGPGVTPQGYGYGGAPQGYGPAAPSYNPGWFQQPAPWQGYGYAPGYPGTGLHNDALVKGLLIGAGATFLLTNETVQKNLISAALKVWSVMQGGVEEMKERFRDAEAEMQSGDKQ